MRFYCLIANFGKLLQIAAVAAVCTGTALATAKTTAVGTCRPDLPSFNTFSDAISGSPDGSTILVCPGTYAEQFTVDRNLTINGIQSGNSGLPVIVPPAAGLLQNIVTYSVPSGFLGNAHIAAQMIVSPGITVNFSSISIDAINNNLPACVVPVGIYYANSSGTVDHVAFRNQSTNCGVGNPFGDGIFVQSDGTLPAVVTVQNSSFHHPGWMAVHADGNGTKVNINGNTAVGPGPTAGNGILVEGGASAGSITGNAVSNALHDGEGTGYWGILLGGCAGNSTVNGNDVSNTQIGINVSCNNNTITNNLLFNTQLDGILICGSGNTVKGNTINDSGRSGVNLAQGCNEAKNTVSNNTINGACTSILAGTDISLLSNSVTGNTAYNTKSLFVAGTTCN
jgi:parallel beta-helix repeat protein